MALQLRTVTGQPFLHDKVNAGSTMYNIFYESNGVTKSYLSVEVPYAKAVEMLREFRTRYIGKQYPNKRGFYPFRNARVVRID